MSIIKVNLFIGFVLVGLMLSSLSYINSINENHYKKESISSIKGDMLELGYTVVKLIEYEGIESSLNLLYKSLATHKEYKALSIVIDDSIILSTDRKFKNKSFQKGLHLDDLNVHNLYEQTSYYHEFIFFQDGIRKSFNIAVDLNTEYLSVNEEEIMNIIYIFLIIFSLSSPIILFILYKLDIEPLVKINAYILKSDYAPKKFFFEDYTNLFNSFREAYGKVIELNKTLEEKVQKRTESLAKTNELFNQAQQLTSLGNWEWSIKDNKIIWSDEIYRIFGLKPQEFAASYDSFINTIHKDDRKLVQDAVNKCLETGDKYHIVHRIVTPTGEEKNVQEDGYVERNSSGENIRMIGSVQDITVSYNTNKKFKLQSELLDSITDSIFVHTMDGSIKYINEAAYKTRGYTEEELLKMNIQNLDYKDDELSHEIYDANLKDIHKQMSEKGNAIFQVSHIKKDHSIIPLEVNSKVIQLNDEPHLISIARDISDRILLSNSLKKSERQYRELVENSQMGIFTSKLHGDIVYVNDALVNIMEYESPEEMYEQRAIATYKNPAQRSEMIHRLVANGSVESMELEVLTKRKNIKHILFSAHLDNDIISGIILDITDAKNARLEISKLSQAVEQSGDLVSITDTSGIMYYVNDSFLTHTGYSKEEVIGKKFSILKSGEHDKLFYKKMWNCVLSGDVYRNLVINRKKSGEKYYEEKTIAPIKDDNGDIVSFVSTAKDITERIQLQNKLTEQAQRDSLTGIYNRYKFEEVLKAEFERADRYKNDFSLIMLDIDFFKKVNDTHGHDVGDEVLIKTVEVIAKNIRNLDVLTRWGGEEFIVLCPQTTKENAIHLAEKLRRSIEEEEFPTVNSIAASFGVTDHQDKDTIDTLLKRVDDALYKAKHAGRNRVELL